MVVFYIHNQVSQQEDVPVQPIGIEYENYFRALRDQINKKESRAMSFDLGIQLRCPKTGSRLVFNEKNNCYQAVDSNTSYPVHNGIIDFLPPDGKEKPDAYQQAAGMYDNLLGSGNPVFWLYNQVVWGLTDDEYIFRVLDHIPDNTTGYLLDIPSGTGIFTAGKYQRMKKAKIIAIDYSINMLLRCKSVYQAMGIDNVVYIRGDIGSIPLESESMDQVLTMNGFHAFPEKKAALDELQRVLKKGGECTGCFYIKGKRKLSDLVVNSFYTKKGWFQPPFYSEEETSELLLERFRVNDQSNVKSIFWFNASKTGDKK